MKNSKILAIKNIKTLNRMEQTSILGGSTTKFYCQGGEVAGGDVAGCHCHGLSSGLYFLVTNDDGSYETYDVLGQVVDK